MPKPKKEKAPALVVPPFDPPVHTLPLDAFLARLADLTLVSVEATADEDSPYTYVKDWQPHSMRASVTGYVQCAGLRQLYVALDEGDPIPWDAVGYRVEKPKDDPREFGGHVDPEKYALNRQRQDVARRAALRAARALAAPYSALLGRPVRECLGTPRGAPRLLSWLAVAPPGGDESSAVYGARDAWADAVCEALERRLPGVPPASEAEVRRTRAYRFTAHVREGMTPRERVAEHRRVAGVVQGALDLFA